MPFYLLFYGVWAYLVVPGTVSRNLRVPANGSTTIYLIPSGNKGNPTNTFNPSQRVQIGVTTVFPFFNDRNSNMKFVPIISEIQGLQRYEEKPPTYAYSSLSSHRFVWTEEQFK